MVYDLYTAAISFEVVNNHDFPIESFQVVSEYYSFINYPIYKYAFEGVLNPGEAVIIQDTFQIYDEFFPSKLYITGANHGLMEEITGADTEITNTTSIKGIQIYSGITYPNPFNKDITIEGITQDVNYQLYSLEGSLIKSGITKNYKISDLGDLLPGQYLLQYKIDKIIYHSKLLKQ